MSSTFGGINILSRSIYAQQASLDTVGHNIANAGTEGYSRQSVNLVTALPAGEVYGRNKNHSGSGVTVASITRARDIFVDQQLWKESSGLSYSKSSSEALSRLEGIFTEPSDTGIQTVLNQFWTSLQTLATQASDSGTRTAVAQRGVQLVNAVQHAAQQLKDSAENINSEVDAKVKEINRISENINKLNQQIYFTEFSGTDHANDLRDSRDLLVDNLSKLVDVSVKEDSLGRYTIQSGGVTLVNGKGFFAKLGTETTSLNNLTTGVPGYSAKTVVDENGNAVNFTNGEVKALIDSRDSVTTGIKGYMSSLEKVSQFLLQDFNKAHREGYGTDNTKGRNFFGDGYDNDPSDPSNPLETDYSLLTTPPEGGWIKALQVNSAITASTDGLKIIAAKKDVNKIAVTVPTNTGIGLPTLSTIHDWGATATNVSVKIASADNAGKVSGITYSTDGGLHWATMTGSGPYDLAINSGTLRLDTSTLPTPTVDDTYNFSLSGTTEVPTVTAGPTNKGSGVPTASSISDLITTTNWVPPTGWNPPTEVKIKVDSVDTAGKVSGIRYSTDGGATWTTKTGSSSYDLSISTGTIRLDASALTGASVDNTYKMTFSGTTKIPTVAAAPINSGAGTEVPTVSTTGTYNGGTTPTSVKVKVATVDGTGKVSGITYSTDGGTNWLPTPPAAISPTSADTFNLPSIKGLTAIEIKTSTLSAPAVGDTYTFSLSTGNNASGDNALLLGNSLKTDVSATLGNTSLDAYYSAFIGTLGVQSDDAKRTTTNQQLVVDQLTNLREQTSGVSLDEEMTNMIKFQKGYNAAARVLTAMDEMLDKLINGTGMVGR